MNDNHWAIFALRDIQNALDRSKYDIAVHHIDDAIHAIIAIDQETMDVEETGGSDRLTRRL